MSLINPVLSHDVLSQLRIAIVVSEFNTDITAKLCEGTLLQAGERGLQEAQCFVLYVPGAVEIPFAVKRLAQTKRYDAVIALGAVIRGETSHYDYVCEQVSMGCQRVMLDEMCPVIFGVLTTDNEAQAWDRLGGAHGHKGKEALDCALHMIAIDKVLLDEGHGAS